MSQPITNLIPKGRENAISRAQLSRITGNPDREVRNQIAEARKDGDIILNRQDGLGYYQPDKPEEVLRWYRQEHARAMKILMNLTPVRHWLKENGIDV